MPIDACPSATDACPSATDACPSAIDVYPLPIDVYPLPIDAYLLLIDAYLLPIDAYLLPIDAYLLPIDAYLLPIDAYLLPIDAYLLPIDAYLLPIDAYLLPIDAYAFILAATYAAMATGHNAPDISVAAMEVTARWDEIDASAEVLSPVAGLAGDNALHFLGARSVVFCGRAAIALRGCVADVRATPMRRGQIDGEFQRCAARWRLAECHSATIAARWRPQNN